MKIAILGSLKSPHVKKWADSLVKRGLKIHVLSMHKLNENIEEGINIHYLRHEKPFGYISNQFQVRNLLRLIQPDIIHSFYALGYGTLGTLTGFKPNVLSVMGSDIYDDIKNPFLKPFVLKNIRNADVVCSTSLTMAQQIENVSGLAQSRIKHTPFGIDINKFKPGAGEEKKEEIVFGTVKFLEDKYGIDVLLKAFALYKEKNQDIPSRLIIVGDGSKENDLKSLAKQLNIFKDCNFMGYRPSASIPDILRSFDVYLALSRFDSESFGVAILEASATGLPVIVSNKGGLPEVVDSETTGIVVESENYNSIVRAMELLVKNELLRYQMGIAGRRRVEELYSWNSSIDIMISIYNEF